jgi:hypothetical protein
LVNVTWVLVDSALKKWTFEFLGSERTEFISLLYEVLEMIRKLVMKNME